MGQPEQLNLRLELLEVIETMNAISLHQTNRDFSDYKSQFPMRTHLLTCKNDLKHKPLYPYYNGKKVILLCPDCEYTQDNAAMFEKGKSWKS